MNTVYNRELSQDLSYSSETITANTKHSPFHYNQLLGWQVWHSPTNCDIFLQNVFAFSPSTAQFSWHAAFPWKRRDMAFLAAQAALSSDYLLKPVVLTCPVSLSSSCTPSRERMKLGSHHSLHTQASQCLLLGLQLPLNLASSYVKPLQLDCVDSQMLLCQQWERPGASHVTFKMTVTKTPLVKKIDFVSKRILHLPSLWGKRPHGFAMCRPRTSEAESLNFIWASFVFYMQTTTWPKNLLFFLINLPQLGKWSEGNFNVYTECLWHKCTQ